MAVKPRSPHEPVFDKHIVEHVLVVGTWMGLVAFLNFQWTLDQGQSIEEARNLTLMLMVLFGNIHALNSRSEFRSLFSIPLLRNPFLMLAVDGFGDNLAHLTGLAVFCRELLDHLDVAVNVGHGADDET